MAPKSKTHEEFIENMRVLVGDEYTVLGRYVSKRTKLLMKHNLDGCDHEWEVTPGNFLYANTRCPKCSRKANTKTQEKFEEEVIGLVGLDYKILGSYKNNETKISIKHTIDECRYVWDVRPGDFLQGKRCPKCAGNLKKTTDTFKREVLELAGSDYLVLDEYRNCSTKITMKHNTKECGYVWKVFPYSITLMGTRCPKCAGTLLKTTEIFKSEVLKLVGSDYLVLDEYKNTGTKITLKHNIKGCGHKWKTKPNTFLTGSRCPSCNSSKGETACQNYLRKNNISFSAQYTFDDCTYRNRLPFDFAVNNSNGKLAGLIEYDGEQHFKPIIPFGGEEEFKLIKIRDAIKTKYCADNGIPLIRIPYWKYDEIDEILTRELLPLLNKSNAS